MDEKCAWIPGMYLGWRGGMRWIRTLTTYIRRRSTQLAQFVSYQSSLCARVGLAATWHRLLSQSLQSFDSCRASYCGRRGMCLRPVKSLCCETNAGTGCAALRPLITFVHSEGSSRILHELHRSAVFLHLALRFEWCDGHLPFGARFETRSSRYPYTSRAGRQIRRQQNHATSEMYGLPHAS